MKGHKGIRGAAVGLGLIALVAGPLAFAAPASATATCTLDEFLQPFVTITGRDAVALRMSNTTLTYDPGADGGYISCGVTTDDMGAITINGEAGTPQGVVLDLSQGDFGSGFDVEPTGRSETEIFIDLNGGTGNIPDALWVLGSSDTDRWAFGKYYRQADETPSTGLHLNVREDSDAEVLFPDQIPGVVKLHGRGGDDGIYAGSDPHADRGLIKPVGVGFMLDIEGGRGGDSLSGSNRDNTRAQCVRQNPFPFRFISFDRVVRAECLGGGPGDDTFDGSLGAEMNLGDGGDDFWRIPIPGTEGRTENPGDDKIFGHEGADHLEGGHGDDLLEGGPGRDELLGERGNDRLDGGPQSDRCVGGRGADRIVNCER